MAQEGTMWPNVMIRLGPHWHKVKLKKGQYYSLVVAVVDVGSSKAYQYNIS